MFLIFLLECVCVIFFFPLNFVFILRLRCQIHNLNLTVSFFIIIVYCLNAVKIQLLGSFSGSFCHFLVKICL